MPISDQLIKIAALSSRLKIWRTLSIAMVLVLLILVNYLDIESISNTFNKNYIARLSITGVIATDSERDILLKQIINNNKIRAVILDIDSPGGTFVGSEILYNYIREIAQTKPVVAVLGNLSASGGYMTALAADHIIAHYGTLTGSIGVITQYIGISELAKKAGITLKSIKSSELKGIMSPLEKLTPEGESAVNDLINDSYDYFVNLVAERRKLQKTSVLKIADGRVYTGSQAVKLGLVDQIGGENEALYWLTQKNIDTKKIKIKDISWKKSYSSFGKIKGLVKFIDSFIQYVNVGILATW